AVHDSSVEHPPEISEVAHLGLETIASECIKVPRLAAAPVAMECRFRQCLEFGDARSRLIVGEVVMFHLREGLVNDGKVEANALADAQEAVAGATPDYALDNLVLLPPVLAPEKLWCIGVNYAERNAEYKDNSDLPKYPSLFVRSMSSMTGSGQPLEKPKVSDQLDYEGELVIVIGHGGRHIPREKAWAHIFGM